MTGLILTLKLLSVAIMMVSVAFYGLGKLDVATYLILLAVFCRLTATKG